MATNKFVTMLHRDTITNKIIVILVDAFLEWILISLLLLNSFFSYLITKFAKWVGLQPPCLWCSRIDHILQPEKGTTLHNKDLVCETHATEISNLSYCSDHQKLAETQSMCEDCFASRPNHDGRNSFGMKERDIGFMVRLEKHENGEKVTNKCSCCNESIRSSHFYPPCLLLKPSWGEGNYASKGSLIVESIDDEKEGDDRDSGENHTLSDIESFILMEVGEDHSSSVSNLHSNEKGVEKDEILEDDLTITELDPTHPSSANNFISHFSENSSMKASILEDRSIEVINMASKSCVPCDIARLIPIKLIDSITSLSFESCKLNEYLGDREQKIEAVLLMKNGNEEKASMRELESLESSTFQEVEELKQDSEVEGHPQRVITSEEAETSLNDDYNVEAATEEPDNTIGCLNESTQEDECSTSEESSTSDDDMGVQDAFDAFIAHNNLSKSQSLSYDDNNIEATMEKPDTPRANLPPLEEPEDQSSTSEDDTEVSNAFNEFISQKNLCPDKTNENDREFGEKTEKTISVEKNHKETSHESSKCSQTYEAEEDKLPETPTTVDGKLMLFEKRETAAEDSIDGSVASEVEYSDPALTIERLKTALNSERKASSSIYQELEEERSASAVAANQTMAMITRLQEEKAAMKMEALQYQRMMEEQAEYDQEALQLLNELMVKREKEKQELEKELEEYKQKVMAYEAKEKLRLLRRMKDGGSVRSRDSSSSYELSIDDLNREAKEEDDCFFDKEESGNNHSNGDTVSNLEEMALDCVKHISALDNSLVEFEEERASILDQLKALEEKIISLGGNEEFLDEIKLIENSSQYGDNDLNDNCNSNVFSYEEDKHSPRKTIGSLAKRLLPYLDEADDVTAEEAYNFETQLESESVDNMQNSVPTIEEEVDRVYERLQALGTDQEFLQHCMGSIQNGDKGMDLLQEILQHLHDLKAVESRLKNLGNE